MPHSILSPSAAHRWTRCPGSVAAGRYLEDDSGSRDAQEGTLAHELAASLLMSPAQRRARLDGGAQASRPPRTPEAIRADLVAAGFDAEGVEADLQVYLTFCRALPAVDVEVPLIVGDGTGERGAMGTADCICDTGDALWIVDLKMGRRPVKAAGNRQLMIYADAVLSRDEIQRRIPRADSYEVLLCIVQPRLRGEVDVWTTSAKVVREAVSGFYERGARSLYLVEHPEAITSHDFAAGDHCHYCPCAGACRTLKEATVSLCGAGDETRRPDRLTTEELAEAWKDLPMIKTWADGIAAEVARRLRDGVRVPGLHLEAGKPGNRRWIDEAEAEKWAAIAIGEDAFERSLKSVAQLEKTAAFKTAPDEVKAAFAERIMRPPGAMRVAEGDPPEDAEPAEPQPSVDALFTDVSAAAAATESPPAKADDDAAKTEATDKPKRVRKSRKKEDNQP